MLVQYMNASRRLHGRRAPLRRSVCGPFVVDLSSTEDTPMGPSNRWYPEAFANAREYQVVADVTARAITPVYFVATKLVAFHGRGPVCSPTARISRTPFPSSPGSGNCATRSHGRRRRRRSRRRLLGLAAGLRASLSRP
jgi:hypothetical protein